MCTFSVDGFFSRASFRKMQNLFTLKLSSFAVGLFTILIPKITVSSCIDLFKFPSQKQERKGGWGPSFASNLTLSFRVLIRPYWPGQVYSLIKDTQIDLDYKNQNVRGRQALKKGQSLIFMYCSQRFCTILRNRVYCFCVRQCGWGGMQMCIR